MARIFVTGATGYIGGALAARLARDGHQLVALVRPTSNTAVLDTLGAAKVVGDLGDSAALLAGARGADVVVHCAAELDFDAPTAQMEATNVAGSERLAEAVASAGVPRLVAFSSVAVWGGSPADGSAATETTPPFEPMPSRYSATKRAGDEALVRVAAAHGLVLETLHPSLVYGPPGKKRGSNVLLRQIATGRMPAVVGGDRIANWIFLDDVVEATARFIALPTPRPAKLLLAGEATTVRALMTRVAGLAGITPPRLTLPLGAALLLARLTAPLAKLRGRRPPLSIEQLHSLARHWHFDDRLARQSLDWSPRPLAAGLPPTIAHLLGRTL